MSKIMLINAIDTEECRIAVLGNGVLQELYVERASAASHVGNVYKGRVTNVEPSIQAAFIDYGQVKNGFLHVSDVVPSYFPANVKSQGALKPPIQTILKRGQEVIVQVTKEGIGSKGATMSTYLSIAGRYLVLMPGLHRVGVSRKIEDDSERRKLRDALDGLERPKNMGVIVRTAGLNQPKTELRRDLKYLNRVWTLLSNQIKTTKCPAEIYRESDLAVRTVRDIFTTDVTHIYIDDQAVAERVRDFLQVAMPRYVKRLSIYDGKVPLFHQYGIEEELEKIYTRTVPLPSGGYLVIEQTEALVSIDVNSGKFRTESNPEEAAYKLNVEAAREIVRQLRLRDLGGVIVMDFVDMRSDKHRRGVEDMLRKELKEDRARSRFLRTSRFGLIEMTRQRMRHSLERASFMDCPHCSGSGLIKTPESMSLDVMRQLSLAASQDNVHQIEVTVHPSVGHYVNNRKRRSLVRLEESAGKQIMVLSDPAVSQETARFHCQDTRGIPVKFDPHEVARRQQEKGLEKQKRGKATPAAPQAARQADKAKATPAAPQATRQADKAKATPKKTAKKRRRRKKDADKAPETGQHREESPTAAEKKVAKEQETKEMVSKSKKRRLRRKRAAGKKKQPGDDTPATDSAAGAPKEDTAQGDAQPTD